MTDIIDIEFNISISIYTFAKAKPQIIQQSNVW